MVIIKHFFKCNTNSLVSKFLEIQDINTAKPRILNTFYIFVNSR